MLLTIENGLQKGQVYELTDTVVTLGRQEGENTIVLEDSRVSRHHARLEMKGKNVVLRDLDSTNGTFVNGEEVKEQTLKAGDEIRLGDTRIIFSIHPSERERPGREKLSVAVGEGEQEIVATTFIHDPQSMVAGKLSESDLAGLQKALRHLHTIYRVNTLISSTFQKEVLLEKIMDAIFAVVKSERGFIMLREGENGELTPAVVRSEETGEGQIEISRTIVNKVCETGESVLSQDARTDERFKTGQSIVDYNIRSAMCVPLKGKRAVLGIIHVDSRIASGQFSRDDLELLAAIGSEAGIVLENARLYEANLRSERLAAIGQTVAGLAHDIRNMLAGLEGGTQILETGLNEERQDVSHKGWEIIKKTEKRISDLVNNMLDYSRERKPERQPSGLNDIMREIVEILQEVVAEKKVTVRWELDSDLPVAFIDPVAIQRALMNIIRNALEAVSEGGELKIYSHFDKKGKIFILKISDTGCGIPPEEIPHIFELLRTSKSKGGTGLGLAVTEKVISEHDGRIAVESEVGKGTTFTVYLPLVSA